MKPDLKKLIITNLPYLLFVWLFGKMGEAWRLAAGVEASLIWTRPQTMRSC